MAKLEHKTRKLLFRFTLHSSQKTCEWIKYEIKIGPNNESKDLSLDLSGSGLYLEACYEPEVPTLCKGILDVLNEKIAFFFFEPIDQEDFQFMIRKKRRGGLFELSIHSQSFLIPKNYNCPACLCRGSIATFTKEEILDFINQLEKEYEEIISKYPKDPKCRR